MFTMTKEALTWRIFFVPRVLPLYKLCAGYQHAIERNGRTLGQGCIAQMGGLRYKDFDQRPEIALDVKVDGTGFFVLVREISQRMEELNALSVRAAKSRHLSLDTISEALDSHSLGPLL